MFLKSIYVWKYFPWENPKVGLTWFIIGIFAIAKHLNPL